MGGQGLPENLCWMRIYFGYRSVGYVNVMFISECKAHKCTSDYSVSNFGNDTKGLLLLIN